MAVESLQAGHAPDQLSLIGSARAGDERARREHERRTDRERCQARIAGALGRASVLEVTTADGSVSWYPEPGSDGRTDPEDWRSWPWDDHETGERWLGRMLEPDGEPREPPDRLRVVTVQLRGEDGTAGEVLHVDGRPLREDWLADPRRTADQVAGCSRAYFATRRVESGEHGWQPFSCSSPLCPHCLSRRAGEAAEDLVPRCAALAAAGHPLVHLTLTQRARDTRPDGSSRPTCLSEWEAGRGWTAADPDRSGYAVGGETCSEGRSRLTRAWRSLRNRDRAAAATWSRWVVGYVYRLEVTGSRRATADEGGPGWVPRWHWHLHCLAVLSQDAEVTTWWGDARDPRAQRYPSRRAVEVARPGGHPVQRCGGEWWDDIVHHWTRIADAEPPGQCATPVQGGEEEVRDTLQEVIKYPAKLARMTDAQVVDYLASTKGLHVGYPGGALHHGSRAGRATRALQQCIEEGHEEALSRVMACAEEWCGEERASVARALAEGAAAEDDPDAPAPLYRPDHDLTEAPAGPHLVQRLGEGVVCWWRPVVLSEAAAWLAQRGPDATWMVGRRDPHTGGVADASPVMLEDLFRALGRWKPPKGLRQSETIPPPSE